ncbi:MAG: GTP-dependent dephospho-CoA kinase family protein [Thaumarchaeota archaeon]|nr:GTP-dependent dephospho-CoA kinase family protein [Candidatus Calditenuaceae archaeon]MDW8186762.1 DUF359 domain-containing protein [Nitrososphaerota archaeon]
MRSEWNSLFPRGVEALVITEGQRERLKRPIGVLLRGSPEETRERLRSLLAQRPHLVVAVGDVVSAEVNAAKPPRVVFVTDDKSRREQVSRVDLDVEEEIECSNEAGTVSRESFVAVERAIARAGKVRVVVTGEEDLLALVAIYLAPIGALVLYGQPSEGVVIVEVGEEHKSLVKLILVEAVPLRAPSA